MSATAAHFRSGSFVQIGLCPASCCASRAKEGGTGISGYGSGKPRRSNRPQEAGLVC